MMSLSAMLDKLIFGPLILLFDVITSIVSRLLTHNVGIVLAVLSLTINLLVLPLYRRADALQEEERRQSLALQPGVAHIKKTFKGNERFMMLQTYYRQNHYKPWYALKGSLSLLLEIPFFIAAYRYLSGLQAIQGLSLEPIADVGLPDGLLRVDGHAINVLPFLMTGINLVSGAIYTRGMPARTKVQLYGMAIVFLALLYDSPAVLVIYWTMNNLFSLAKNLFYRLRDPKKALRWLCMVLGLLLLALAVLRVGRAHRIKKGSVIIFATGLALQLPLILRLLEKRLPHRPAQAESRGDRALFFTCCVFLTLLTGALLPLDVIKSSPAEFIDIANYHSSLYYVLSSLLLAAGTFLVWCSIYYFLSSGTARRWMGYGAAAFSAVAVVDYTCFGGSYGTMSAELQYETFLLIPVRQYLVNLAALAAAAGVVWLLWSRRQALLRIIGAAACLAVLGLSVSNAATVQRANAELIASVDADEALGQIGFPLDRTGRNVVVMMLDRGLGRFIPYIMAEKPGLMESFDGFTWYPNVLSYGSHTNVGSPELFGGYEYTPLEMNRRDGELLVDKHDEALSVMPVLFLENGYDVTVCDPPYAGYSEVPDLSIYDEWPEINGYLTMTSNAIDDTELRQSNDALRHRSFFCYSIFRASPLLLHKILYNNGRYNELDGAWNPITKGMSQAHGLKHSFMKSYGALGKLPEYSQVRDEGKGTFLMINNETTHSEMLLQEPDYVPALDVDNTAYDAEHDLRVGLDGTTLQMTRAIEQMHYQINMAALLQVGKWLDFMKENGVYDNTRIIIVSDHGYRIGELFGLKFGAKKDMFCFCPMLLVKDFDATGFTIDDAFMTNADTPLLALNGLVDAPVNPFTGKALTDAKKLDEEQLVAFEGNIRPSTNHGTTFKQLHWYANRNSPNDPSAWRDAGSDPE